MNKPFLSYLATLIVVVAVDLLFWGIVLNDFINSIAGSLLSRGFDWSALAVMYVVYTIGLFFFVVRPQARANAGNPFTGGALYGLVVYGTVALLNDSINPLWPSSATFLIFVEAAVVAGAAAMAGVSVGSKK